MPDTAQCDIAGGVFLAWSAPVRNIQPAERTTRRSAKMPTLTFATSPSKWLHVERAADGSAMFGFMAGETCQRDRSKRRCPGKDASPNAFGGIAASIGKPVLLRSRRDAAGAAVVAKAARFAAVFLAVAWLMMAVTKNAGGAAHHVILLWPFPIMLAVSALSLIPWRWLAIPAAAALVLMNLLVVNQYVLQFERAGAAANFTDAIFTLDDSCRRIRPSTSSIGG